MCWFARHRSAENKPHQLVALSTAIGIPAKRPRKPARTHNLWPEPLHDLMPFTALYMCYHRYVTKELWSIAGINRVGAVKSEELKCVPGPCAELFLTNLSAMYGIEIKSDHEENRSNVTHSLELIESSHVLDICAFERNGAGRGKDNVRLHGPLGDLHLVSGVIVDWVQPRDIDGMSRIKVTATAWKITASDADPRPGTPAPSVSRWMEIVKRAKRTLNEWADELGDDEAAALLSPRILQWVQEPTVEPVTNEAA